MLVPEWPRSVLHGAQKGLEAREVDEHEFSSGDAALSCTFACPMTDVRHDANSLLTGWTTWGR